MARSTPAALRAALRPDTALVTLALANHELGNVYDSRRWPRSRTRAGALFHADAVQAAGKIPVDVDALGVDALTLSAHKIHGPKGVGAIFLRRGAPFEPAGRGGHQERERRAGTENVAGIVGFGVAARLAARGAVVGGARGSPRCAIASKRGCSTIPGLATSRRSGARAARDAQRRLRGRARAAGRGGARSRGGGRLDRRRLHLGIARALAGAAGARVVPPGGGLRAPLRPRPRDDARGDRARRGAGRRDRRARSPARPGRPGRSWPPVGASGSSSPCRAASIPRRPPRCWSTRATTSSASPCGSTTRAAPPPASAAAAAARATSRTRARRPRTSASPTT